MKIYDEFCKHFIDQLKDRKDSFPNWFDLPNHRKGKPYLAYKTGKSHIQFYTEYTSGGYSKGYKGFTVGVYMDNNGYIDKYNYLSKYQRDIHKKLNDKLDWIDTGKAGRIFKWLGEDIFNKDNWAEIIKFQIDNLIKIIEVFKPYIDDMPSSLEFQKNINLTLKISTKENKMDNKIKNIILYGVPGVGKTYSHKKLIDLIESKKYSDNQIFESIESHDKNDSFDKAKKENRVKFITFHQSFGYEDFIEGFRPNEDGKIELVEGVFKSFCEEASKNIIKSHSLDKLIFDDAFDILLKERIENDENVRIELNRENSFYEVFDYNKRSIYYTRQGRDREEKYHTLSISTLKIMYESENDNIITGGLKTYYRPLLKKLLEIGKKEKIEKVDRKNYYLVIDEINRGNISKIFGELITLIEEDKRDTLQVTLPYSKNKFSIPSNLYIIGTMNSTDKSIALIDIALRRRFTFIHMTPNPELVKHETAQKLMIALNTELPDEYKLGHSYFMKIENEEDLVFACKYKIQPLLEEYFYGDNEGLDEVLAIMRSYVKKYKIF